MAKERVERDEEDLVRLYLTDIGQYPLLTKEDEVRLAQAIEHGKQAAEELEIEPDMSVQRKRELRRTVRKGRVTRSVAWATCRCHWDTAIASLDRG